MILSETKLVVRYGETDQMGYVYYGNYALYYEVARTNLLKKYGLAYKKLEDMGVMLPVIENHTFFHLPGKYDEELTIVCRMENMPQVKLRFDYEIFNPEGKKINHGYTILAFIDMKTNRPVKAPDIFINTVKDYFPK